MKVTAARMLARDWRGGELGVLVAALILAVAVVTGISAFTSRLQAALEQESHRFLAADVVVTSAAEMPASWRQEAQSLAIDTAQTLSFPSMVFAADDNMFLASIKAVSEHYPLRGELRYSEQAFAEAQPAAQGPESGSVWLDSRLFALLDVSIGDSVSVGEATFQVAAAVRSEPDQSPSIYNMGPRVLMHFSDIAATEVVQPGSRVEYRQLFAGEARLIQRFVTWLEPQLQPGQRLLDVKQGQPGIGSALQRAESFLLLAGSLAVVLAGVAIALAARRFSERHTDYVAIMKSLGASSGAINRLYGSSLLLLGLAATTLGCALGWLMQAGFFAIFAEHLPVLPGPSGIRPYAIGFTTAFTCLLCFAWPPLRRLAQASPLRVLRRDMPHENRRSLGDYLLGLLAVAALMFWYSGDWRLSLAVLLGLAITIVLGLGLALSLLRGGRLLGMSAGSIWRLALAGLQRRGSANALQVVIFAMAIMLLLVLVLLRTSLIDEWQAQLPPDAPNHFMLNIAPEQLQSVTDMLRSHSIPSEALYPMVSGRVMSVNGEDLPQTDDKQQGRRQRGANFTWADSLPAGNELLAGQWWETGSTAAEVSLEEEFAERLGLAVGDTVGLLIAAEALEVKVSSIRKLDWQSFRPNFFMVFPPKVLADYPATFMTSFHLDAEQKSFLNQLIRTFPTITVIEMDLLVEQVRAIIDQVSAAIELVLAVILAAGALVLVAGVQASVDMRMQESSILRALGAGRRLILGGLAIEFATMGLFAGLLATIAAEFSVFALQVWVMEMSYAPTPWLWPLGIALGVLLITGLGLYSCRKVVSSPPLAVLREL
ncbi:ABC transporter permease [Sediminihaliea albiluteola]|nr:FtsX-like permease family protein [Sediminihaliea albiluteola]